MLISQYSLPAYVTSYRVGMKLRFGVPNMKFALKYTCSRAMNCVSLLTFFLSFFSVYYCFLFGTTLVTNS